MISKREEKQIKNLIKDTERFKVYLHRNRNKQNGDHADIYEIYLKEMLPHISFKVGNGWVWQCTYVGGYLPQIATIPQYLSLRSTRYSPTGYRDLLKEILEAEK